VSNQKTDFQIAVCGSAGDGTIAAGDLLKQAMADAGYRVIAFNTYPAEIRGFGKCIARTRITSEQVYSMKPRSDVLVSLNDGHAIPHVGEVRDYGAVIYESAPITWLEEGQHISGHLHPGQIPYGLPFRELCERATGSNRSRNMVALGFVVGLYGMPREAFHAAIAAKFQTKAPAVTESSIAAFEAGANAAAETHRFDLVSLGPPPPRARAVWTPAWTCSSATRSLRRPPSWNASRASCPAGASACSRPRTRSPPSPRSWAAATPARQRGGPSTGMPTSTEQSDLNMAVFGGAGDAQRIVLAPTNVEGCWRCAGKAFEMAERYQTPVIVLLDLYLSNRFESVTFDPEETFELEDPRGKHRRRADEPYRRFELTASHLSPRAIPGEADGIHTATGLEHDEFGHPSYEPDVHTRMSEKRHAKLAAALEHPRITICKRFGDEGPVEVGILTWGSTFGEALEAMMLARKEGIRCAAMKVVMLSPLPVDRIRAFMEDSAHVLVPELNYQGQFANLVSGALGRPVQRLNRVTGKPMEVSEILESVRALASKGRRTAA
jgi:2-oxoglutarate ferredoxin oxidoreductase subunit alpha